MTMTEPGPEAEGETLGGCTVLRRSGDRAVVRGPGGVELSAMLLSAAEAEAVLGRGLERLPPHEHRERLVDAGVGPTGSVLLTTPPIMTTLDRVLDSGRVMPPGVVVTVLAPVVAALREAGKAGVLLVPDAEAVGFTAEGRPVLLVSRAGSAAHPVETEEAARVLLARCRQRCPEWPSRLQDAADLDAVEAVLYAAAAPLPLGELLSATPTPPRLPQDEEAAAAPRVTRAPDTRRRGLPLRLLRRREPLAPSADPAPAKHRRAHPFDGWRRRLLLVARERRGPLTAAVVILVGAVVASTPGAGGPTETRGAAATATSSPRPAIEVSSSARVPAADVEPEEAARRLLSALLECDGESARCVGAVTTPDSPLRQSGTPEPTDLLPDGAEVAAVATDVNGASALVSIEAGGTTAASVLMIRTEAGWLIRDVLSGEGS